MTTKFAPLCFCLTFSLCAGFSSLANPVGGSVSGGDANATITGQGTALTTINQSANRVIINWQDFSIGAGEVTRFIQPSARSAALNRIMSGNPSQIYGSLQANGRVFVINPSGILVGPSGQINTKGFVASTLDVSDASFKAGGDLIFTGTSAAAIRNHGTIQALGGDVYLIAHNIENSGSISAPQGTVGLAAGNTVELVQSGNEHVSVLVGNSEAPAGGTGVNNLGTIEAASAELKAAGGNIYALAINNGGAVRATGIVRKNGHVYLRAIGGNINNSGTISAANADGSGGTVLLDGGHNASSPSTVASSGTITARGDSSGTQGGTVEVLGDQVGLFNDALVDVSGDAGGGTALIGGDYRGANPDVQNAEASYIGPNARIQADALTAGNGGEVVVWSDGATRFYGAISAQGGPLGGDGGVVETSGHYLDFQGIVSTLATSGNSGSLLLDPTDLTIDNTSDQNINGATPFVPSDTPSHLTWATIDTALGSGNVTVTTIGSPNSGAEPGDITVAAASPALNRNNDLTLDAAGALNISSGSTIANSGTGNLNLTAADTATIDAGITLAGGLSVTAPNGIAVNAALQAGSLTLNNAATLNAAGTTASPSIQTGGGGQTYNGTVTLGAATVLEDTANGAITFNSTINGAQTLELNTAGATTLGGSVGGGTPLTGLETDNAAAAAGSKGGSTTINGTSVGAATITFGDAVTLGNDVAMTSSSGPVTLGSTVDATTAGGQSLTINGDVSLGGAIGASTRLGNLEVNSPDAILIGQNITANSVAVHSGTSGTGDTTFAGVTVDADTQSYQAGDGPAGAATAAKVDLVGSTPSFNDTAGAAAPASFTYRQDAAIGDTAVPAAAQFGGTMPAALVLQSDDGGVTLPALTLPGTLQVTANGPITDNGAVTVAGSTTLAAGAGNDITLDNADDFGGAVSTTSAGNLTLNDANALTLGASTAAGALNATAPGGIAVNGAVRANSVVLNNAATLNVAGTPANPSVQTSGGGQTYGGAVTLAQDTVLEDTSSGAIDFNSTVNADSAANNRTLNVNTGGATTFGGSVGDSQPLAALTTDAAGSTVVNGTAVNATAVDFKDDVTLGNNVAVAGTTVSFEKTVNADNAANNRTLTVNASGDTTFGGTVGNSEELAALTTDPPGNTALNGDVSTTGNQTYNDNLVTADGITLTAGTVGIATRLSPGGDATAASLTVHGDLSFGPGSIYYVTLNGKNNNQFDQITINSGSTLIVDSTADIAGQANFSFAVNNSMHIVNNNGNISGQFASTSVSIDGQQFAVSYGVGHDVILTRSQSSWVWDGGGGGNNWSTKNNWSPNGIPGDGDTITFDGNQTTKFSPVNDITGLSLNQIIFQNPGSFTLSGDAVALTAGIANNSASGQTINMPITLAADQTFSATAGGLAFGGTIDGAFTLVLNGASPITLGAPVGGTTPLSGLAVNSTTPLTISGPGVITSGAQTYSSPVTLGNTATLTSSGGLIALGSTVDGTTAGAQGLTVNGALTLGGAIGGATALGDFAVNSPTTVAINQNITANSVAVHSGTSGTGDTTFGAGVVVKADTQSYQAGDGAGGAGNLAKVDLVGGSPTFNNTAALGAPASFTYRQDAAIGSADVPAAAQFGGTMPAALALQSDDGGVTLPALALPGTLQVTANGPITDNGALTVAGATALAAGAGNDITLDNADDFGGAVSIASGNNVTLNDLNALALGASTVSGNLTLAANGLISDNAAVNVVGTTALAAGAGNDITLDNADDFGGAVSIISGNNVTLHDVNALTVGGAVGGSLATTAGGATAFNALTVGGNLNTVASGLISDNSALTVVGTTTLAAGAGNDITLDNGDDFGGEVSINSGNNVTLNDANALTLGASTVSGNLSATASGPISDSGNVTVAGTTTLAAGPANNISLVNADDFGGAVNILSGNNVSLNDVNALTVGGAVNGTLTTTAGGTTAFDTLSVGGNLVATANGLISDNGNVAVGGATTLAAGAGNDITLDNADDFGGAVNISSGNNVTLNDVNALTVGGTVNGTLATTAGGATAFDALNVSGDLTATANGLISDNGNVAVAGTTTLAAGPGNDITLDNADDFGGAVDISSGNNVTLNDVNALTVGGTVNGALTSTAGGATTFNDLTVGGNLFATANGLIDDNGNVTVAGTTALAAGSGNDIVLDNADDFGGAVNISSGNNVTLNDVNALTVGGTVSGILATTAGGPTTFNALSVGGNLNAVANGLISDNGNVAVAGTTTLAAGAGNDITLDNADDFGGAVNIGSGNNVTLNDVNALTVGGTVNGALSTKAGGTTTFDTLNVSDSLAATANGLISDNGNVAVLGTTTLAAGAGNDITLDNADGFGGAVSISSGNNVTLNDVDALDLGVSAVSGNLNATANGPITDSGNLTVAGATTLAAGAGNDITLDNANNFGGVVAVTSGRNVTLNDANALALGASTVNGNLTVTAGGPISQSGALTANGAGATATFSAGAANITLNNPANDFTTVSIGSGNNILLADANGIDLGASTVSGQLVVTAGGNITESGSVSVTGNSSFATAGGNSISLDQSGNEFNGSVAFSSTDLNHLNNVAVANNSDFNIGGLILDGTLSVTSGGQVTQSGNIAANALQVTAVGPVRLGPGAGDAVSWLWNNQVNTVAAQVQGAGNGFSYLGQSPLTVGTVNGVTGITTADGNITLSVDSLTILNQQPIMVDSGTANTLVQPQTIPWSISFDVNNNNNALFLSQDEVNRFTAKVLQIGNVSVLPIIGRNLVVKPGSVGQLLLVDNSQTTQVGSSQLAQLLAGAILPVPKLNLTSFSGAAIDAEAAAKILPPGSIGTLFLQVPFVQPERTIYKIEDVSKWTGGLLTIAGTTSGAQTPR